jgi:hypothetical protein
VGAGRPAGARTSTPADLCPKGWGWKNSSSKKKCHATWQPMYQKEKRKRKQGPQALRKSNSCHFTLPTSFFQVCDSSFLHFLLPDLWFEPPMFPSSGLDYCLSFLLFAFFCCWCSHYSFVHVHVFVCGPVLRFASHAAVLALRFGPHAKIDVCIQLHRS